MARMRQLLKNVMHSMRGGRNEEENKRYRNGQIDAATTRRMTFRYLHLMNTDKLCSLSSTGPLTVKQAVIDMTYLTLL